MLKIAEKDHCSSNPGWNPGSDPSSNPGSDPGSNPGSNPCSKFTYPLIFLLTILLLKWPGSITRAVYIVVDI